MISGTTQLYFGTTTGKAFVFDDDTFSDDGNDIALRIRTKEYYLPPIEEEHEIQDIYVFADEPQATNLSIAFDGGDYEYLGQITGKKSRGKEERFRVWDSGVHFSLGLDEISTRNILIRGFNVYYG